MVGDCAGDSLANPPGGVGGELIPAGMVEPVDRSHQAGVALLDQVQEAQAAVAVAFGDGNGQSQVGGRQIRPCGFVFRLRPSNGAKSAAKRDGGIQRGFHQLRQFLAKVGHALAFAAVGPRLGDLLAKAVEPLRNLSDSLQDRHQVFPADGYPFQQPHRLGVSRRQSLRRQPAKAGRLAPFPGQNEVGVVPCQQALEHIYGGSQVVQDAAFFVHPRVCQFDDAIDSLHSLANLIHQVYDRPQPVPRSQDSLVELLSGRIEAFGQGKLVILGQQGNPTDLKEVTLK